MTPSGEVGARAEAIASNQRRYGSWVVGMSLGTDAMGEMSSPSTFYRTDRRGDLVDVVEAPARHLQR